MLYVDTAPNKLGAEVIEAEQFRDKFLTHHADRVNSYTSSKFRSDRGSDSLANHGFEYVSLTTPKLVYANPRYNATPQGMDADPNLGPALKETLNTRARATKLRRTLDLAAVDMQFLWSVLLTRRGDDPRADGYASRWPIAERISQYRFVMDPLCLSYGCRRYAGHLSIYHLEDVKRMAEEDQAAGWNLGGAEKYAQSTAGKRGRTNDGSGGPSDRKEVCVWDLWVPGAVYGDGDEFGPHNGYNGVVYSLFAGSDPGEVSDEYASNPRPYYGPPWGPYSLCGAYIVPDVPYPMSPLAATHVQAGELNKYALAANASASGYKRLIICGNVEHANKIINQKHDYIVVVPGMTREQMEIVELGGITSQMVDHQGMSRGHLDRAAGMSDAKRGEVNGDATATENAIADASSETRVGYLAQKFSDMVIQDAETAAWYMTRDQGFEYTGSSPDLGRFSIGGRFLAPGEAPPNIPEIEIEPYSLSRVSEQAVQARFLKAMDIVTKSAAQMPQTPWVRWKDMLADTGNALNVPNMHRYVDDRMLGMMGVPLAMGLRGPGAMIGGQMGAMGGGGAMPVGTGGMGGMRPTGVPAPGVAAGLAAQGA